MNKNMIKVSVIMAVYNIADPDVLGMSIQSILQQTLKEIELIICDDASTDNTCDIIKEIIKNDKRVKFIRNKYNLKAGASRNRCIKIAKGKYIAIMDADDYSYPKRLEYQVNFLDSHPEYAFVSSLVDCYDGKKIVRNHFYRKAKPQKKDFLSGTQFVHPATMFRKECLLAVYGYRVKRETQRTEDYDLFMRLYSKGFYGYNIQKPLLRYFVNPSAMINKRKYRYRIDEAIVRLNGFHELGLMPLGIIYVFRPLIIGLIPKKLIWFLLYKKRE